MEQIKNRMDSASVVKTFKGACIAGGAVALLYILQWLTTCDFGQATALIVGLLSVAINAIREFREGN